uniref:Rapamycin-insensitive companion of mTOR domain-containing protein n=1 Tax=Panagrolaimus sp. JU765 TaxID=591449 RepID=A0AC34QGB7_9BILA
MVFEPGMVGKIVGDMLVADIHGIHIGIAAVVDNMDYIGAVVGTVVAAGVVAAVVGVVAAVVVELVAARLAIRQIQVQTQNAFGVLAGSDSIPDFGEFGMKLMISQLGDRSTKVVRHALRLLHFWLPKYPQSLPFLARTALEPLGSAGVLLKSHLFGSEKLVQAMKEETKELVEYWMNGYLVEYVRIIEEDMRMALLNVRRTIDGTYARSSNERFEKFGVPMPIHLFGQLSSHSFGRSLLADLSIPIRLLKTLQEKAIEKDDEILEVKAALLATGHIAANLPMGFIEVLMPPESVPILCRFAEECPTLSIRGTAIWALSLVGKSEDGARLLASLGWESNRFIHIVDEVCDEFSEGLLSKSVVRRSRTKSNCRTVWSDSESRKKLSTLKAKSVDDFGLPEWKKHYLPQKLPAKIRRANSEAQIVLPVLMNKKPGEKLSTIKVSPSNPEDVRPDRTFTQESAVTSGFGSAPHEEEKTANNSESSFLPPSLAKFHHRHYLPENKPYKTDKKEFPFAPSLLPDLIEPSTFSNFFNDDFDASIGSNYYSTGELPELNREKFDLSEVTNYPHFSSVYRRQHGIHGFEQENLLKIPNRTHSSVLYSFFSRSELKNVEKFEKLLNSVGEWIPGDVPRGGRKIVGCVGWTVVSLPSQIALICKNIFKNERNLATNRQISIRTNSSAQRCLFCLQKIAKGLPTNHFNSIDPRLRKDVLNFVSFFEIRGSSLQKLLSKKYGNKLQTAFENPCVYSDAVELLSVLNHNRKSRKEIQNLFSCAAKCAINIYG